MHKLAKEPLLHFIFAGAAIFAVYGWLDGGAERGTAGKPEVRIAEGDVTWLARTWARQWNREPTREELRGLVADFLEEQLLARKAQELGLAENDTIVRRRLAQKLDFLVQDTARLADPTEDELRRLYEAHPPRFRTARRISFAHVFFGQEGRDDAAADARAALAELAGAAAAPADLGDRSMLESEFDEVDEQTVAASFGPEFAAEVTALAPGPWRGPIESGYGWHLVRVSSVQSAEMRPFPEVRPRVLERWREEREREHRARFLAGLMEHYEVVADASVQALVGPLVAVMGQRR